MVSMRGLAALLVCSGLVGAALNVSAQGSTSPAQTPAQTSGQGSQGSAQSLTTTPGSASAAQRARRLDTLKTPTKDDLLRGEYGPYRANNDLLFYHLDIKVDPETKSVTGSNTVRFRMLQDGTRIQLELAQSMSIDSIKLGADVLKYTD